MLHFLFTDFHFSYILFSSSSSLLLLPSSFSYSFHFLPYSSCSHTLIAYILFSSSFSSTFHLPFLHFFGLHLLIYSSSWTTISLYSSRVNSHSSFSSSYTSFLMYCKGTRQHIHLPRQEPLAATQTIPNTASSSPLIKAPRIWLTGEANYNRLLITLHLRHLHWGWGLHLGMFLVVVVEVVLRW